MLRRHGPFAGAAARRMSRTHDDVGSKASRPCDQEAGRQGRTPRLDLISIKHVPGGRKVRRMNERRFGGSLMKLTHIFAAAVAVCLVAVPATAQFAPPPPPFVVNPALNPPPGVVLIPRGQPGVNIAPAVRQQQQRANRDAVRSERAKARAEGRRMNRHTRANACHLRADEEGLSGRARRRFVWRCRHGR